MAGTDIATPRGLRLPASAVMWWATPAGGPGGQHANKSDTRVTVRADLGALAGPGSDRARRQLGQVLEVVCGETRSQARNRAVALERLIERLDEAAKPQPRRRPTKPSRGAVARRLEEKRQRSQRKTQRAWRPDT